MALSLLQSVNGINDLSIFSWSNLFFLQAEMMCDEVSYLPHLLNGSHAFQFV